MLIHIDLLNGTPKPSVVISPRGPGAWVLDLAEGPNVVLLSVTTEQALELAKMLRRLGFPPADAVAR